MKYVVVGLLLAVGMMLMTNQPIGAEDEDTVELAPFPKVEIKEETGWPGFYLPDLDGNPLSVQDYRGKKIVLHIFASW